MTQALSNVPASISPLGHGHTHLHNIHPSGPDEYDMLWLDYAARLTNRTTGRFGGNPAMIAHRNCINIYTTAQLSLGIRKWEAHYAHYEYIGGTSPLIKKY